MSAPQIQSSMSDQAQIRGSMRTKASHLNEIDGAHSVVKEALERIRMTRRNVPTGSYVHRRLVRSENELGQVMQDLWFTFHVLDQHDYDAKRPVSLSERADMERRAA